MTVFKTFWKIVNRNKLTVILYTVILLVFAGANLQTSENSMNYVAVKPNVLVICNDEEVGITKNLQDYIKENCNIVEIKQDEEAINDALFYRDISYIITIPKNYREDFNNGLDPKIEVKSVGDAGSSYAEMILSRYMKVASIYKTEIQDEEELINKINDTLAKEAKIEMTTKLDTDNLSRASFYYNFLNYCILASLVYVICFVISSFRQEKIRKRTIISSMNYKKFNRQLLLSNALLTLCLWVGYVLLSFVLVGKVMFTMHGLIFIANSFVFTFCSLCIAFLIANMVNNKNAINGIVNVVGLGTSFLCGAFVPVEWIPDTVLKIAHVLPSYWYIQNNELVKTLEQVNIESMKPIITNMAIVLIFSIVFIVISNIIARNKRKIG